MARSLRLQEHTLYIADYYMTYFSIGSSSGNGGQRLAAKRINCIGELAHLCKQEN